MELTEEQKRRIRSGEKASVCVSPEYFRSGDYTHWQKQTEETEAMTYEEYIEWLVEEMHTKYLTIVLHSDGCLYGLRDGISHDISYEEFNRGDCETFIELIEEFGCENTLEFY